MTGNWKFYTKLKNNPKDKQAAMARAAELNYGDPSKAYAIRKNHNHEYEIWHRQTSNLSQVDADLVDNTLTDQRGTIGPTTSYGTRTAHRRHRMHT